METVSVSRSHGGVQGVYKHASTATGTDMMFSVFVPPHADGARLPVVWYLSGLTCSHANVTEKGGIPGRLRRTWVDLRRPRHQSAR
jgi:S-formylglutathione hydrolase